MKGADIVKTQPQLLKAIEAAEIAEELLKSAEEKFNEKNIDDGYATALHAMRMASAALMFMDGIIAPTLDGAVEYLKSYHPTLDAEKWKKHEYGSLQNKGILDVLLERVGVKKNEEEKNPEEILYLAKNFVFYASKMTKEGRIE